MKFFVFRVEGIDLAAGADRRGFFTTRRAFGTTKEWARQRLLKKLRREFTMSISSVFMGGNDFDLRVEEGWEIGFMEYWRSPSRGSTLYDEGDAF